LVFLGVDFDAGLFLLRGLERFGVGRGRRRGVLDDDLAPRLAAVEADGDRAPGLEVDVGEPPGAELIGGPSLGVLEAR